MDLRSLEFKVLGDARGMGASRSCGSHSRSPKFKKLLELGLLLDFLKGIFDVYL